MFDQYGIRYTIYSLAKLDYPGTAINKSKTRTVYSFHNSFSSCARYYFCAVIVVNITRNPVTDPPTIKLLDKIAYIQSLPL